MRRAPLSAPGVRIVHTVDVPCRKKLSLGQTCSDNGSIARPSAIRTRPTLFRVDDRRTISYRQLQRLTRQIATFLAERGIRSNDRIALLAGNSIEHLACYIGVMAYGATICTIHVEMNRRHLAQIMPTS